MVVAVAVADMVEVDTVEAAEVAEEVSTILSINPRSIADGTNKDVGRRFHLF